MPHTVPMHKTRSMVLVSFVAWVGVAAGDDKPVREIGTGVGHRIPPFTAKLLDASVETSAPKDFDSHRQERTTAYIVIGTRCPATRAYAERLAALERTYAPKQVDVVYIYPNREDTREAQLEFHKEKQLRGPLIDDRGGSVASLLGAQKTSEVVLADRRGTIVYRGAIDDSRDAAAVKQRYLATALDETLAGKPVTVTTAPVRA